ncbi:MAG: tetratricopeptide repeat protein [Aureispira sp.]|nr:tetratricopeptide repeat protein [Aureispira sp.]
MKLLHVCLLVILGHCFSYATPPTLAELDSIAGAFYDQGDYPNSVLSYQKLIELAKKEDKDSPFYANSLAALANVYREMGLYDKSEPLLTKAIALTEKNKETDVSYAHNLKQLGLLYLALGKYTEAEQIFLETLDLFSKILGEKDLDYAVNLNVN